MNTTSPDPSEGPEAIARWLAEPIAATWQAFDIGRTAADEFFAAEDRRAYDPHMWAHIARYEASLSIRAAEKDGWMVRPIHHSGIEFTQGPYTVRVCKAVPGGPQSPGRNFARRQFFQQLSLPSFYGRVAPANLILYWRVREGALELGLCKPKGVWRFRGQPRLEWRCPVQYDPLAGLSFPVTPEDDLDVGFRFDEDDLGEEGLAT